MIAIKIQKFSGNQRKALNRILQVLLKLCCVYKRTVLSSGVAAPSVHSRLTPCLRSLCRALLGSENALSCWLGMPEFLMDPPCCWK